MKARISWFDKTHPSDGAIGALKSSVFLLCCRDCNRARSLSGIASKSRLKASSSITLEITRCSLDVMSSATTSSVKNPSKARRA